MMTEEKLREMKEKGALTNNEYLLALEQLKHQKRVETEEAVISPEKLRQYILFSVVLLAVFSILAGLGLIIAANWDVIPAIVKVAGGLVLLLASLLGFSYFTKTEKTKVAEVCLFTSFMLIGGNIALIQQVYHLALTLNQGSFAWWLLSLPLLFMTKYRLLLLCSLGLLGFSIWDYIWEINYMVLAGALFVLLMITHFFEGKTASLLRYIAGSAALLDICVGDIMSSSGEGTIGFVTTIIFLILALNVPKGNKGIVRYYNLLFAFVAWRICLLFWNAYYDLTSVGIRLVSFGTVLLIGVGLYYYYFDKIQEAIKKFVTHEQN